MWLLLAILADDIPVKHLSANDPIEAIRTRSQSTDPAQRQARDSEISLKSGIRCKIDPFTERPKNDEHTRNIITNNRAVKDHDRVKEDFIFWIFKSDHLELRNTLPKEEKVALSFVLRSNKTLKAPSLLW
jgi:hypothetical protein